MIQIELSKDIESRLNARARAQGVEAGTYVKNLIENAVRSAPLRTASVQGMDAFFEAMAADSHKLAQLPEEAFTRESFYRDHD